MLSYPEYGSAHANNSAVDNDFHQTHAIFSLFEGLGVEDLDKPLMNGHESNGHESNGHESNGHESNGSQANGH